MVLDHLVGLGPAEGVLEVRLLLPAGGGSVFGALLQRPPRDGADRRHSNGSDSSCLEDGAWLLVAVLLSRVEKLAREEAAARALSTLRLPAKFEQLVSLAEEVQALDSFQQSCH